MNKFKYSKFYVLSILLAFTFTPSYSVPAYPKPITVVQSDGTSITILLKGDEFDHYTTTLDGYLIKQDARGVYRYVVTNIKDSLVISDIKANDSALRSDLEIKFLQNQQKASGLVKNRTIPSKIVKVRQSLRQPIKKSPVVGNIKGLVFLIEFSDVKFTVPNPSNAFSDMLNVSGYSNSYGQVGSARDYFKDNSTSALDPSFVVVGPITLPNTMAYYGENDASGNDVRSTQALVDACIKGQSSGVFNSIDFSQFDSNNDGNIDNLFFFFAGYNEAEGGPANSIWPNAWNMYAANYNNAITDYPVVLGTKHVEDYACASELKGSTGTTMAGIGTFSHEFGHVLGLPDIYDTDYAASGGEGYGLNEWSIMSYGAYNNHGFKPAGYTSYERYALGWITPTELTDYGKYTLDAISTSNKAYIIKTPEPDEYFLLENRQKTGWDASLHGHGMLVIHIDYLQSAWDYNIINVDPAHQRITLVPGDNNFTESLAGIMGDPYPGTTNNTSLTDTSTPAANLWTNSKLGKPIRNIAETNGVISFSFLTPPAPLAVIASGIVSTGFTANWNASINAAYYHLEVYTIDPSTSAKTVILTQNNISTNSFNVTGLSENKEYCYTVKAIDTDGLESPSSNEIKVKTTISTDNDNADASQLKAYMVNGQIILESKYQGKQISIFDESGKLVKDMIITAPYMTIPMDKGEVYFLKVEDQVVKVIM